MSEKDIHSILKTIKYPNLDKNIVELGIVNAVNIQGGSVEIILEMDNNEAFGLLGNEISKRCKDITTEVLVSKKSKSKNHEDKNAPNNRAPYAKKVIAVTSGKGGVGKSTVVANLSVALAGLGHKIGLLDADVYNPSIPHMLSVQDEQLQWNDNNKIIPIETLGIKLMSVGLTTSNSDTSLVRQSFVAVSTLIQLLEDVEWGELDFLIIDIPLSSGDAHLTIAQKLPNASALLVTTPQNIVTDGVSRAIMMFKENKVPIEGVVENMSYFIAPDTQNRYDIFGTGGANTLYKTYGIPLLGQIPLDMQIREYSDEGKLPVKIGNEKQKSYYQDIVRKLVKSL